MRAAGGRGCALAFVLALLAAFAAPALADPSVPDVTAAAVNDREVDVSWTWPAGVSYPDFVEVFRNGVNVSGALSPQSTQPFADRPLRAGGPPLPDTSYTYTVVDFVDNAPVATSVAHTERTRADLPNAPAGVAGSFDTNNTATVSWMRGGQDSDVTYTVTASQDGTTNTDTVTTRYAAGDASPGSATFPNLSNYTGYTFTVSAVEDVDGAIGDPGGTVTALAAQERSNDIFPPTFVGDVMATRSALSTVRVTWPEASDPGSGVRDYEVCVAGVPCASVEPDPLGGPLEQIVGRVPNDGAVHAVTVTAYDRVGNASPALGTSVSMQPLAAPVISGQVNGCGPLLPQVTTTDGTTPDGTAPSLVLSVNDVQWPIGQPYTGSPYTAVVLKAWSTLGADRSAVTTLPGHVYDPDGPQDKPVLTVAEDVPSATATVSWPAVVAPGAPVKGYRVTSPTLPGYTGPGTFRERGSTSLTLSDLDLDTVYELDVSAVDECDQPGPVARTLIQLSDTTPPSVPTGLTAQPMANGVSLSWNPSHDDVQLAGYYVLRDGRPVSPLLTAPSFFDRSATASATSTYQVEAVDHARNVSAPSAGAGARAVDTTAPSAPGHVTAQTRNGVVTISWDASTDDVGVAGYRVYRCSAPPCQSASSPGSTFLHDVSSGTTYADPSARTGMTSWGVVAYDAKGNASPSRWSTGRVTAAAVAPVKASRIEVVRSGKAMRLRIGNQTGARIALTFRLPQDISPAQLTLRILSGAAKLRVSLEIGTGRTIPGHEIVEKYVKKGLYKIGLGKASGIAYRLIITQTKGKLLTLAGPGGGSSRPTVGPAT
jgi:hypothetical protein